MEQNTPYNPFAEGVSTAAPDSFQAAIDYLLKGRQQATAQRRGLFTQLAPVDTPTTNVTNVVKDVFGDRYRSSGSDSGGSGQLFTGNPYSGKSPFGPTTAKDVARWSALEGGLRANPNAVATIGGLLLGPLGGVAAKYGAPAIANYFGERSYDNYLAEQDRQAANVAATQDVLGGQVGTYVDANGNIGTISNQAMIDAYDRAVFGDSGSNYDSLSSDAVARSLSNVGFTDTGAYGEGPGGFESRSSGGGIGVDGM